MTINNQNNIESKIYLAKKMSQKLLELWPEDALDIKFPELEEIKELSKKIHDTLSYQKKEQQSKTDYLITMFDEKYPKWRTKKRLSEVVIPRQVLTFFLCIESGLSLKSIGLMIGGFDHSTVINNKRVVTNMILTKHPLYVEIYEFAEKQLKNFKTETI